MKIEDRHPLSSILYPLSSIRTPARLLALGIVCYIVVFTLAAGYKYATYQMGFDLGVHQQVLWNTARGRIAATSAFAATESYLGIDIIPTELLLAPLYALAPSIYTMLFLQTLALGLGAVPVYLLVRDRFARSQIDRANLQSAIYNLQFPGWAGLVFAAAFLLYLPVEYMNLYEFQIRAFATTFLLWALLALERRRFGPFLLWALLALGCRSEAGLVLAGMGLAQLRIENEEWRKGSTTGGSKSSQFSILNSSFSKFGLLPIILGLGWFALCLGVLIPYFRGGAPSLYLSIIYGQIDGRPWLGDSPGAILRTLLTRPGFVLQEVFGNATRGPMRLRYLLEMFLPFGFLLLLQPRMLLITLPIFALNLLSNTPNIHASTRYHYQALIIPFMVVGSAYGLDWLIRRIAKNREPPHLFSYRSVRAPRMGFDRRQEAGDDRPRTTDHGPRTTDHGLRFALVGIFTLALACNIGFRNPFFALLTRPIDQARIAAAERLLARVPPDAPLATTSTIGPHASRRERIFFFPGNVIYPEVKIAQAQYLLIDLVELLQDQKTRAERQQLLADLQSSGRYRRLAEEQGIALWQRVGP